MTTKRTGTVGTRGAVQKFRGVRDSLPDEAGRYETH
jgi:hypothetical protein